MNTSLTKGSLLATLVGVVMACTMSEDASAQTRFRYNSSGQINSYQTVPRATYNTRTYIAPNGQRYVAPTNQIYSQVTPTYRVSPGYNSQQYYSQPYRSGYRGSTTVYPNYNTYPSYNQGYNYAPGYGYTTPGYYPAPGFNSGYRGYVSPGQQRGATIGGSIGEAIGGNRGGNIGAAIGAAVGD